MATYVVRLTQYEVQMILIELGRALTDDDVRDEPYLRLIWKLETLLGYGGTQEGQQSVPV